MKHRKHRNETRHIVHAMHVAGNRPIERWKDEVAQWAQMNRTDPNAVAVNAWLPLWQVREIYSAQELAPIWPALAIVTGFTNHWPNVLKSAKRLEHELIFYGLPYRTIREQKVFAVERLHHWRDAEIDLWEKEISDD